MNPYIFGQGNFTDVEKLRQSVEYVYDFDKCVIVKRWSADAVTKFGKKILENPQNYEVMKYINEQRKDHHNIEVNLKEKEMYDTEFTDIEQSRALEGNSSLLSSDDIHKIFSSHYLAPL